MIESDYYQTIEGESEALFKDKSSKFLAFAFNVNSQEKAEEIRKEFKKKYYDATHVVYAFRIGREGQIFRAADDGEPSGSSGTPVLNAIKSKELSDVLVIVVRYFGGTKLGIPGLINAYRTSATMVLDNAKIIKVLNQKIIKVRVPYAKVNYVMRIVKENNLNIKEMTGDYDCQIDIECLESQFDSMIEKLDAGGKITI